MTILSNAFLFSHGANAIFAFVLIITSIRLYLKSRIRLVLLMTILMGSWMITNSLLIIPLIFKLSVENNIVVLIAAWNVIGSAVVPSVFILFIDVFEGEIDPKKVAVAIATIVASFFIALMGLSSGRIELASTIVVPPGSNLVTMRWSPITSLAIFPTVIACGIWTQKELSAAQNHVIDPYQMTQIRYMRLGGIFMFFIGPAFGILGVILVDGFQMPYWGTWASEIVGYTFVSIGIIMISLAYTTADEIAFLQPQRIDSMLVIHETGVPVFTYDFSPQEDKTEIGLVSGAITAITALMDEAFNVQTDIREIVFHDKELLLEFKQMDDENELAYILITDRKSPFLETAITSFANSFTNQIKDTYKAGFTLSDEAETEAINKLRTSFGLSPMTS